MQDNPSFAGDARTELFTTRDYLDRACRLHPDREALRFKRDGEWQTWTFAELARQAAAMAQVAHHSGQVRGGGHVALMAENGPEWVAVYLGLTGIGLAVVHVDPKLSGSEAAHILRDSGASALFAGAKQALLLAEVMAGLPELRHVFVLPPDKVEIPSAAHPQWHVLGAGSEALPDLPGADNTEFARRRPGLDDVASLIYTSGTTGLPKGAVLTHANFSADVEASLQVLGVEEEDDFLVVLPLHHAFGFMGNLMIPLATGCRASYVESLKTVGDNLRECSPTILLAVPLLAEKLYNRMMAGIRASLAGRVLNLVGCMSPLRRKVMEKMGGCLRLVISGGAPCPPHLFTGLRRLGITIIEGYGLTETSPVATLSSPESARPGTVGRPLPGNEVRIVSPNAEGDGEIAIKGPIVMRGYYRRPGDTAAVFDGEWFLTGDLGKLDGQGYLTIVGRKKNLIVNREGKNIYPEEVESVINRHPWVLESVVCGYQEAGETGERVGAIVVPDLEVMAGDRSAARALRDDRLLREMIRRAVRQSCKELSSYKHPRTIKVRSEPFDKTPTQKIKRYLYRLGEE